MRSTDFAGKTVVITGAARGLGAAFAVVLADQGASVIMTARNTEGLTTLAEAIRMRTGTRPTSRPVAGATKNEIIDKGRKRRPAWSGEYRRMFCR